MVFVHMGCDQWVSLSRVNAQVCNDWQLDEIARLSNGAAKLADSFESLPGIEGAAARVYFSKLRRYAQDDRQSLLQLSMAATLRASRTTLDQIPARCSEASQAGAGLFCLHISFPGS